MQLANQEAQRFNHEYIGTEHILLGLVKEGSGVAANVLKNLDVDLRKIRLEVEKLVQSGPEMVTMGKLPQTPRAKKVIEYSMEEARNLNHNYVGTEHILLGLLREQEGVAAQVLMNLGLKLEEVREEVLNLLGAGVEPEEGPAAAGGVPGPEACRKCGRSKTPALDSFGRDLTELARQNKLDPVIVRLFNTVGPKQTGQYGMVIPNFVKQALAGRPITVFGDGSQSRCFTDVADVVRALIELAEDFEVAGERAVGVVGILFDHHGVARGSLRQIAAIGASDQATGVMDGNVERSRRYPPALARRRKLGIRP